MRGFVLLVSIQAGFILPIIHRQKVFPPPPPTQFLLSLPDVHPNQELRMQRQNLHLFLNSFPISSQPSSTACPVQPGETPNQSPASERRRTGMEKCSPRSVKPVAK